MKGVWDCAATSRVAVIRAIATLRWRRGTIAVVRLNDTMMRAEATFDTTGLRRERHARRIRITMANAHLRLNRYRKGRRTKLFGDLTPLRMAYGAIHGVLRAGENPTGTRAISFIDWISTTETSLVCALAT